MFDKLVPVLFFGFGNLGSVPKFPNRTNTEFAEIFMAKLCKKRTDPKLTGGII